MILVDTSIWIDHLRVENPILMRLLDQDLVVIHDYVIGELAAGSMPDWPGTLLKLLSLPRLGAVRISDILAFVRREKLQATGLGFVDVALLASAQAEDVKIWARDKKLARQADALAIAHLPAAPI